MEEKKYIVLDKQLVIELNDQKQPKGTPNEFPPILYSNFKMFYPGITFEPIRNPEHIEQFGYGAFDWEFKPEIELEYNKSYEDAGLTKRDDGIWKPTWIIVDATAEEINARKTEEARLFRDQRDALLIKSDFIFAPDAPEHIKNNIQAWVDYRQKLRDLTLDPDFPIGMTPKIPKKPE